MVEVQIFFFFKCRTKVAVTITFPWSVCWMTKATDQAESFFVYFAARFVGLLYFSFMFVLAFSLFLTRKSQNSEGGILFLHVHKRRLKIKSKIWCWSLVDCWIICSFLFILNSMASCCTLMIFFILLLVFQKLYFIL